MANLNITQQDIADALNISRATVSKVFNGKPINEKVREAVLKKALELGYIDPQPSHQASVPEKNQPAANKNDGFLLLICFPEDSPPPNMQRANNMTSAWQNLIKGIEKACERYGYSLIVSILDNKDESIFQLLENYTMSKVDGIILTGDYAKATIFLQANKKNVPIVLSDINDMHYFNCINLDVVVFDIIGAMSMLVKHLVENNYKKIAFVGDPFKIAQISECRMGFFYGCMENRIQADVATYELDTVSGSVQEQLKRKLASVEQLPEAFVCENDSLAKELMEALESLGPNVLQDICIAGFDGTEDTVALGNGFTTTLFSREDLGYKTAEQLVSRIKNPGSPFLIIRMRAKALYQNPGTKNPS